MMSSVLRILTSGILAGMLIKTGSAEKIADVIVQKLGEKKAIAAITIATMIICAVGVSILLIGTGTLAGIIKASALQYDVIQILEMFHMPAFVLAPLSGILMAGATASTTAGATVASQTFSGILLSEGVPAVSAAAMIHAGATVVDSLPHGSFFHATGGSVNMTIKERLSVIPYEACVGLTSTVVAVLMYMI